MAVAIAPTAANLLIKSGRRVSAPRHDYSYRTFAGYGRWPRQKCTK